ncbi:MAG: type II toxin-antitoxin system VapC family toxin [Burkholderiaceae bacterium]|nr:type II toxin-antitoxin system VapC family toxin [Burkholderiaceae bacterium]
MHLIDTSVWIQHFRYSDDRLRTALEENRAMGHDWITGELACGHLQQRKATLEFLSRLPKAPVISSHELIFFINEHRLFGVGLGFVDLQLLAACRIANCGLWTNDKALINVAKNLKIGVLSSLPH